MVIVTSKYHHHHHLSIPAVLVFVLIPIHTSAASSGKPSELVQSVCNHTSNYTFCESALSADPRTPRADSYGLAFIAFGMAYLNASATSDAIAALLHKTGHGGRYRRGLERCGVDYGQAVASLEMAYDDLNSETFFELADLAGNASRSADDCQAALGGGGPLAARNSGLKGLCEICVAVSKLFTGGF